MALNWFKKNKKEPRKSAPAVETEVQAAPERPAILAPVSPALRSFHISEKSTRGMALNQYTFMVAPHATKTEVRDAVKRTYHVDVVGVNIINLPAKKRRLGNRAGTISARRKAVVILKAGQSIAAAQP